MQQENVKIVMVGTTHPGNIGAAARVMRNTGFSALRLVDPQCPVGEIATARASGASGLLDDRETHATLAEAIADCRLIVALSARRRSLPWPELDAGQLADRIDSSSREGPVALVFGRERSGLTNDEVQLCHYMHAIPSNPDFSSMNVAVAVGLICHQLYARGHVPAPPAPYEDGDRAATSAELEGYFTQLQQVIEASDFLNTDRPGQLMPRLRRLFLRSELSRNEINILRGILASLQKRMSG